MDLDYEWVELRDGVSIGGAPVISESKARKETMKLYSQMVRWEIWDGVPFFSSKSHSYKTCILKRTRNQVLYT